MKTFYKLSQEEILKINKRQEFEIKNGILVRYNGIDKDAVVPETVTEIGKGAFSVFRVQDKKVKKIRFVPVENIQMPIHLEAVGDYAFAGCSRIVNIIIPDDVSQIGEGAFFGCSSLVQAVLPDKVKIISAFAFSECENLEKVTLPDTLEMINDYAFAKCRKLSSVSIPGNVKHIGKGAFYGCDGLKEIRISGSITDIAGDAVPEGTKVIVSED